MVFEWVHDQASGRCPAAGLEVGTEWLINVSLRDKQIGFNLAQNEPEEE
jgi:hypothetical protein